MRTNNEYQNENLSTMMNKEDILDHTFALFNHLEDVDNDDLVDAVYFFSSFYKFDLDVLPPNLYKKVIDKMINDTEESLDHLH